MPHSNKVFFGDCRESMCEMVGLGIKAQTCVTSPPYFGLRSYLPDGLRLKQNLSKEERDFVLAQLNLLDIHPTTV